MKSAFIWLVFVSIAIIVLIVIVFLLLGQLLPKIRRGTEISQTNFSGLKAIG